MNYQAKKSKSWCHLQIFTLFFWGYLSSISALALSSVPLPTPSTTPQPCGPIGANMENLTPALHSAPPIGFSPTPLPYLNVKPSVLSGETPLLVEFDASNSWLGFQYTIHWKINGIDYPQYDGMMLIQHSFTQVGKYIVTTTLTSSISGCSKPYVQMQENTITVKPKGSDLVSCEYQVISDWGQGFVAEVRYHNRSEQVINDWAVSWTYRNNSLINHYWGGIIDGADVITAKPNELNKTIYPGATGTIGIHGINGDTSAELPIVQCHRPSAL